MMKSYRLLTQIESKRWLSSASDFFYMQLHLAIAIIAFFTACCLAYYNKGQAGEVMIKEVIVVEGKMDIEAVRRAVDAECMQTGGFGLSKHVLDKLEHAYKKRGLIILTDPDSAGERIRRFLSKRFPAAKHAFVPREEASSVDDIGIEQASPSAIRSALAKVRFHEFEPECLFSNRDMMAHQLSGANCSAARRAALGALLGIGYANAKTFLYRLNHYGISREEFMAAAESCFKGSEPADEA